MMFRKALFGLIVNKVDAYFKYYHTGLLFHALALLLLAMTDS